MHSPKKPAMIEKFYAPSTLLVIKTHACIESKELDDGHALYNYLSLVIAMMLLLNISKY